MSSIHFSRLVAMAMLLLCVDTALAGNVTIPNTFVAHTPALANDVNDNFGAVATAVNGNATDIARLQAALVSLQATVTTLNNTVVSQQATISTLTSQMAAVQGSSVMALAANLDMVDVPDPNDPNTLYPTAQFHGINVQIINGTGGEFTLNGLGNLIVGYNPTDLNPMFFCSDGDFADLTSCQTNGGTWAGNQRSGSHNLIVGAFHGYSQYGGFLAGAYNIANGRFASVSGGGGNLASGTETSVSGGVGNRASGYHSSVSGGFLNVVTGQHSSVSGGQSNSVSGNFSSVCGGLGNTVSGGNSSVSGGTNNTASGNFSSVSGGNYNQASGSYSSVSGGFAHDATGDDDWRAGALFEDQ